LGIRKIAANLGLQFTRLIKKKAAIFTGEPYESDILEFLKAEGFTLEDLLGFYVTRQIPEWKRSGQWKKENMGQIIQDLLTSYQQRFGNRISFNFKEFTSWYASHVKSPKSYSDINVEDVGPYWDPSATYLQKISGLIGIVRDRTIVLTIAGALREHSNVLVVYGASHLLTQLPALEDILGHPGNIKWY
jgi:hypothetical protein